MQLTLIDWIVIVGYLALSLGIGIAFSKRAGRSLDSYFLSGRSMPWWLLGVSMVATTFAADTPLAVTGMVAQHGIAGNWLWWSFAFSGMLTVFFYARLWRRAEVLTDVEFAELRYAGRPAAFLRGFRALYLALPINCIILGWVMLGMSKVLELTLGVGRTEAIVVCLVITAIYATISGLWGVVVTDFVQFALAMFGSIALAWFAADAVGGLDGLWEAVRQSPAGEQALAFFPGAGAAWMPALTFFVYLAVNWWASWYPGAEPGGGGYVAQRMLAAKDERHSVGAVLFFNVAHYALRPWPWIIVALAAMVLYPQIEDKETGYVLMMVDHLPPFFRGILLAAFLAAFMSTVSTHLNWGASYLVNDVYKRFAAPEADSRHLVAAGRAATLLILGCALVTSYFMESVAGAWKFLLAIGAGTGPVYLLRWYWWRINAWSEVSAMIAAFASSLILQFGLGFDPDDPEGFAWLMFATVGITTACWVGVTFLTAPEPTEQLLRFYRRVRPCACCWSPMARLAPEVRSPDRPGMDFLRWILGCALVYSALFGIGKLILGHWALGLALLAAAVLCAVVVVRGVRSG